MNLLYIPKRQQFVKKLVTGLFLTATNKEFHQINQARAAQFMAALKKWPLTDIALVQVLVEGFIKVYKHIPG